MPASQPQLDDIAAAVRTIDEATAKRDEAQRTLDEAIRSLNAKVETIGVHMEEGDAHSLTGQSIPVLIKQNGRTEYRIIPAGTA